MEVLNPFRNRNIGFQVKTIRSKLIKTPQSMPGIPHQYPNRTDSPIFNIASAIGAQISWNRP